MLSLAAIPARAGSKAMKITITYCVR